MWLHAYCCFDRLKHARLDGIDLDGINTLRTSGSLIVVQQSASPSQIAGFGLWCTRDDCCAALHTRCDTRDRV